MRPPAQDGNQAAFVDTAQRSAARERRVTAPVRLDSPALAIHDATHDATHDNESLFAVNENSTVPVRGRINGYTKTS
ncbi:hypothetical protein GCM10009741_75400 [Kribbella lupini]|uniref:Uncharacterized protein n=1 Tax=Kribbella lupini TaxID=291602 RepID=A0ABN2CIQ0_9ACTN